MAGNVSDEEITRRRFELAELKIHPKELDDNRLLLERADRLYEQLLGAEREQLGQLLGQFTAVLETQDTAVIEKARLDFTLTLDALERFDIW
ncbi:MAG: hypothetical protein R8K20_08150 [Gallionellaceae bacterium]